MPHEGHDDVLGFPGQDDPVEGCVDDAQEGQRHELFRYVGFAEQLAHDTARNLQVGLQEVPFSQAAYLSEHQAVGEEGGVEREPAPGPDTFLEAAAEHAAGRCNDGGVVVLPERGETPRVSWVGLGSSDEHADVSLDL